MTDIEYRTFEVRESKDDGRTLIGMAVPYNERSEIAPGVFEKIMPGTFEGSEHVLLRTEHNTTIGTVTHTDTPEGLMIEARIANTQAGSDAIELYKAGAWDRLSVGFAPVAGGTKYEKDGTAVQSRARLFEVSLTGIPAYQNAKVLALRESGVQLNTESENTMPDNEIVELRSAVTELRESNEDLTRRVSAMPTAVAALTTPAGAQFRTAGDWLKAVHKRDENAMKVMTEQRAFTGTAVADVTKQVPWLSDAIRLVSVNSVAVESFRTAPLPATGMSASYLKMGASTLQVQKQVAEGDVLAFGKLNLGTGNADIETFGGYTTLSKQALERADVDVLTMSYNLLAAQAAIRSNAAFIGALAAANGTYQSVTVAANTFDGWMDAILDSQIALNNTGLGLSADFILVSTDVFRKLAKVTTGNFRLMGLPGVNYGPDNNSAGSATLPGNGGGLAGSIAGFPVRVDSGLAANTMYIASRDAAVVLRDANPTRLGPDEDVTRLTEDLSVYFYQASNCIQFANGIVKVTLPA